MIRSMSKPSKKKFLSLFIFRFGISYFLLPFCTLFLILCAFWKFSANRLVVIASFSFNIYFVCVINWRFIGLLIHTMCARSFALSHTQKNITLKSVFLYFDIFSRRLFVMRLAASQPFASEIVCFGIESIWNRLKIFARTQNDERERHSRVN